MSYPSVTQILSPWSDFSRVRPDVLANAAERGTRIHQACSNYVSGFMSPPINEHELKYLLSFTRWFDSTVEEVISVEQEYKDETYKFMGHPDAVVILKGDTGLTVADWKTPRIKSRGWKLQISSYAYLTKAHRGGTLRLSPEGKKAIFDESTNLSHDFAIFLNCLTAWKFFNENG